MRPSSIYWQDLANCLHTALEYAHVPSYLYAHVISYLASSTTCDIIALLFLALLFWFAQMQPVYAGQTKNAYLVVI